jgi:hypothetical protein
MTTGAVGYTPGSFYKRTKSLGLYQPRNMKSMNRQAAESVNTAFLNTGSQVFEAKASESQGFSELAANQLAKRVQAALQESSETRTGIRLGTSSTVDQTA